MLGAFVHEGARVPSTDIFGYRLGFHLRQELKLVGHQDAGFSYERIPHAPLEDLFPDLQRHAQGCIQRQTQKPNK